MKEKVFNIPKYIVSLIPLMAVLVTVITSLGWGVPNKTINNIVLPRNPEARAETIKLISEVSSKDINTRDSLVIEGKSEDLKDNLRIARRYLLYSENPDEMMALAGLSGINPKALKFKPKCFNYGGGYIYPMGAMIAIGEYYKEKLEHLSFSCNQ